MKDALDDVSVDSMKPIAIFQGSPGEKLFLEVMMKVGRSVKMDLILQGEKDYHEIKNNINKYGLDKTKLYISSPKEVVTCISEPVSTFFVLPESSNLEQIRLSPDYLLHFKSSSLDEIIANQKLLLNEAYDNVEEGGQIVYMVTTLSKKESVNIVKEFMTNHDVTLVKEKQYFPCDNYDSTLYIAVLRKGGLND